MTVAMEQPKTVSHETAKTMHMLMSHGQPIRCRRGWAIAPDGGVRLGFQTRHPEGYQNLLVAPDIQEIIDDLPSYIAGQPLTVDCLPDGYRVGYGTTFAWAEHSVMVEAFAALWISLNRAWS